MVIIYSHPVRNVLLFEIQSRKATNNNLEYFQLKRHQKAVVLWKLKQSKFFFTSSLYDWITFWRTSCCFCSFIENVLVALISYYLFMCRAECYLRKLNIQKRLCMHLFWSRFAVLKRLSFFFPGAIVRKLIQEKDEHKLF